MTKKGGTSRSNHAGDQTEYVSGSYTWPPHRLGILQDDMVVELSKARDIESDHQVTMIRRRHSMVLSIVYDPIVPFSAFLIDFRTR